MVRRVIEKCTHAKDLSVFDELVSSSFGDHEPGGPESEKWLVEMITVDFPDWRWSIEDQIAEVDRVGTRYTARGTYRGEFMVSRRPERRSRCPA
jgi:predicted ester cyclase